MWKQNFVFTIISPFWPSCLPSQKRFYEARRAGANAASSVQHEEEEEEEETKTQNEDEEEENLLEEKAPPALGVIQEEDKDQWEDCLAPWVYGLLAFRPSSYTCARPQWW